MPKIQEFSLENYHANDYKILLASELENKAKKVSFMGAVMKNPRVQSWSIVISDEDMDTFKASKKAKDLLLLKYKKDKKEKTYTYNKLKAKCDFCLHDVKSYQILVQNIEEFTYCGATSELEVFEKRYMKSKGYTKALYRARSQEFNKIKC